MPAPGDPWRCRRCHRLAYRSSQEAHHGELIHVALERIERHLEATGGNGEGLFDGLSARESFALCRALPYIDADRQEREWRDLHRQQTAPNAPAD
jgi:hypothetical protein